MRYLQTIDFLHKPHTAPVPYQIKPHFVTKMCAHAHISVTKWCFISHKAQFCNRKCTFRLPNCSLRDICLMHCGMCGIGLLLAFCVPNIIQCVFCLIVKCKHQASSWRLTRSRVSLVIIRQIGKPAGTLSSIQLFTRDWNYRTPPWLSGWHVSLFIWASNIVIIVPKH